MITQQEMDWYKYGIDPYEEGRMKRAFKDSEGKVRYHDVESEVIHGDMEIIGQFRVPKREGYKDGRIILVDRGSDGTWEGSDRYVVSFHCFGDSEWCQGHYFTKRENAVKYFMERIERGY